MDPPGRPRRGVRPRQQPRTAGRGGAVPGCQSRTVRRHPRRRVAASAALATGCARVNIGTAALENPLWCAAAIAEFGDKVAVGLDVQIVDGEHRLRGRGWETDGGDLWQVLERLDSEGCSRFVVTDVTKDGTLTGPNLDLLEGVAECTDAPVIASGGVSSLDDLRAIATLTDSGVEGAIVGKALYAGRFTLPEALGRGEPVTEMTCSRRPGGAGRRGRGDPGPRPSEPFIAGHRADSAVQKKGNDFATEVDLAIERQVVAELSRPPGSACTVRSSAAPTSTRRWSGCSTRSTAPSTTRPARRWRPSCWVCCATVNRWPGLTWLPFTGQRYTAVAGGPLYFNGVAQPSLGRGDSAECDRRDRHLQRRLGRAGSRAATGWRCSRTSAGCVPSCGCTAPPVSTWPTSLPESSVAAISFGDHIWDHAAGVALVRAAGGVGHRSGRRRGPPTSRSALAAAPGVHEQIMEILHRRRLTGGLPVMDVAVRVIPCLDVDAGRVVKGVNFENLRDAGDPVELAAAYDAEGADELTLPRRHGVLLGSGDHARRGAPHRRAGVHPAHRRRRGALGRRRRCTAAGRCGQGVGEHRRDRPPGSAGRAVAPVRFAVHRAVGRRPHRAGRLGAPRRRAGRSPPTAAGRAPGSTRSNGQGAEPNSASARSC